MRVGMVCPYDMGSPGGVQQMSSELAHQLRLLGEEVRIVGAGRYTFEGGPGHDDGTVPAGRPISLRGNRSRVPLTLSPTAWWKVHQVLSAVDLVHLHEPFIPLVGWAALATSKPTVVTFHADPPRWVRSLYRLAPLIGRRMRRARITAVSQAAARVIPPGWGEVTIVPNGIDAASFDLPVGRVARRVCFLGRDEPRKGLDILLRAWPRIRARHPDAELMVMGADRGPSPPGTTYLGRVSAGEKKRVLASSAILVAPNTGGESFGIVIAEGMAAGCAVVASDLEPFLEVMGDAGVSFPAGDVFALADLVTGLLEEPERARALGDAARARVHRYDWSEVAVAYRDVYRTVVGET